MALKDYDRLFIGGEWAAPEGTQMIEVISPSTEEVVARVPTPPRATSTRQSPPPPRLRPRPVAQDGPGRAWPPSWPRWATPSPPR